MNRLIAWLVVFLPVVCMAAWLGSLWRTVATAPQIVLRVEGYDPRDLLSGHYLRYRVQYGPASLQAGRYGDDFCACFAAPAEIPATATWMGECWKRHETACPMFLRGSSQYPDVFVAGIERYYIPERYSSKLARVPNNAVIRVAVPPSGRGVVRAMEVEGEDVIEWAKRQ